MGLGLQTARALVVDDDLAEAQPVLLALARLGMGAVYLNGELELLPPDEPFRGVRLAFVDMNLQGDPAAAPEEFGRQAGEYLATALSPHNGMLAVLAWTKHPEAAEAFYTELRGRLADSAVLEIGVENKPPPGGERAAENKILSCITEWLEGSPGMRLLWEWEQLTHEAATATSEDLVEVTGKGPRVNLSDTGSVSRGLVSTLGLLSSAAANRPPDTGLEAVAHAFSALVPILEDRAEHAAERFGSISDGDLAELLVAAKDRQLRGRRTPEQRARDARLNRMVHVSRRRLSEHPLLPGNVYRIRGNLAKALPFDASRLIDDIGIAATDQVPDDVRPIPVVVEVSPACDHANVKVGVPRVLGGALFPKAWLGRKKVPSHAYIYSKFGLFHFDEGEVESLAPGLFHLAFNARYLAGVPDGSLAGGPPLFRIRQNTLVDLQAWLGAYGSRPGVTTITP